MAKYKVSVSAKVIGETHCDDCKELIELGEMAYIIFEEWKGFLDDRPTVRKLICSACAAK